MVEFRFFFFGLVGRNSPMIKILVALICLNYLNGATKHSSKEIGCVGNFEANAIDQTNQRMLRLNVHDIRLSLRQNGPNNLFFFSIF